MLSVTEKLLAIVCPNCGEPDLLPFAADGLVGRCNACQGTFVIQGEIVSVGFSCPLDPATASRPIAALAAREPASEVHGTAAPEPATAPIESASAPQPTTLSNRPGQSQRNPKRRVALYVGVPALILAVLIVGRGIVAPSDGATPPASATSGTLPYPLSESDNGYAWNRADEASRMALCETFARDNNSKSGKRTRNAKWFYDVIHSFYNANPQAPILRLEISQPVKLGTSVDGSKQPASPSAAG